MNCEIEFLVKRNENKNPVLYKEEQGEWRD
jgi:hypothetical protein